MAAAAPLHDAHERARHGSLPAHRDGVLLKRAVVGAWIVFEINRNFRNEAWTPRTALIHGWRPMGPTRTQRRRPDATDLIQQAAHDAFDLSGEEIVRLADGAEVRPVGREWDRIDLYGSTSEAWAGDAVNAARTRQVRRSALAGGRHDHAVSGARC